MLTDPEFSEIITIGDGALSHFYLEDGDDENDQGFFDWYDAIIEADHLKDGEFIQRHCGHYARKFNFPLGGLVVRDYYSVSAPVGNYFYARGLDHPENELIVSVQGILTLHTMH